MNPKGNYKPLDIRGLPRVYEKDDVVTFNGSSYVSKVRNTHLDGTPDNSKIWLLLSDSITHTSGKNPPTDAKAGDEWYDTNSGILFKYIDDGDSRQWVEIV